MRIARQRKTQAHDQFGAALQQAFAEAVVLASLRAVETLQVFRVRAAVWDAAQQCAQHAEVAA